MKDCNGETASSTPSPDCRIELCKGYEVERDPCRHAPAARSLHANLTLAALACDKKKHEQNVLSKDHETLDGQKANHKELPRKVSKSVTDATIFCEHHTVVGFGPGL